MLPTMVDELHVVHLPLHPRREAGEGLVVRDLEAVDEVARQKGCIHSHRRAPASKAEKLQPPSASEAGAYFAKEPGVSRRRSHSTAFPSFPAGALEPEKRLDGIRLLRAVANRDFRAQVLGESPALTSQLAPAVWAQAVEVAALGRRSSTARSR